LGVSEAVLLPGVIADRDLPTLYRCADAFVFPSVKEGWGLVVMEAIASGLVVVTADRAPFTEFLTSEQAFLVDVEDPSAIAVAMQQSSDRAISAPLIERSQSILADYTWEKSAQMHLDLYSQA
jgi:glycosyltransferase involved in cell wall biosynthesis